MIGMCIVDDEPFVHSILSQLVDYKKIGIDKTQHSYSAEDALKTITTDTKIVVVDIKMPGMSGIEFIEFAFQKFPWLKFIVLSGYDDFDYVRETFRCGAVDYFLKSELVPEEFEAALANLVKMINTENTIFAEEDELKRYINQKLNNEVCVCRCQRKTIEEFEKIAKRVFVIKILDYNELKSKNQKSIEQVYREVEKAICCVISGKNIVWTKKKNDEFILIIPTGISYVSGYEIYDRIVNEINKVAYCIVNGGLSKRIDKLDMILHGYEQVVKSVEYCYIVGNGRLITYSSYANFKNDVNYGLLMKNIKYYITSLRFHELKEDIDKLFDVNDVAFSEVDKVRKFIGQCYYEIENYITKNEFENIDRFDFETGSEIVRNGSVGDFKTWVIEIVDKIIKYMNKYSSLVNRTIAYAYKNYSDPGLKLYRLANDKLYVTYNHLSRVFRIETGMSFTQYLKEIRMKRAIELMNSYEYKLYEISSMVGYLNYENFSRTFKSFYGTSPKQFLQCSDLEDECDA